MVHTPGLLAWAINGAKFEEDRPAMVKVFEETYRLPTRIAEGLVTGRIAYTVEGETVVFEADDKEGA